MGQAESVLGQAQPGEGVEYLVIVIGLGGTPPSVAAEGLGSLHIHLMKEDIGRFVSWARGNRLR